MLREEGRVELGEEREALSEGKDKIIRQSHRERADDKNGNGWSVGVFPDFLKVF